MKFNYKNKGHVPLCNLEAMKTTALHLTLTVSYHDNTPTEFVLPSYFILSVSILLLLVPERAQVALTEGRRISTVLWWNKGIILFPQLKEVAPHTSEGDT